MEWTGLIGVAGHEGDVVSFGPCQVSGQWTPAGSSTTLGPGRYVVAPVATGDRAAEARG
jgi:hypothetical protein